MKDKGSRVRAAAQRASRFAAAASVLVGAGCGDGGGSAGGSTTPAYERVAADRSLLGDAVTPVRIGELGPNFAACNALGRVRDRAADGDVPVRAAPYDQAREVARLSSGAAFFICSRSHDQRWVGVVWNPQTGADRACGVSLPVRERRDYEGPCASGWVSNAQVRLSSAAPAAQAPPEGSLSTK